MLSDTQCIYPQPEFRRQQFTERLRLFVFVVAAISGCSKSSDVTTPIQSHDSVVVFQTSFEANGIPSLQGWIPTDTLLVRFSTQVPIDGGSYSLQIVGLRRRTNWVVESIPATRGTNFVRMSFWARRTGQATPYVVLGLKRGEGIIAAHGIPVIDTAWTSYAMDDTLAAEQGDSLWVKIDGGSGESWDGTSFYDLIALKRFY